MQPEKKIFIKQCKIKQFMRYLIFGNGWIGNKFKDHLKEAFISNVDITDYYNVRKEIIENNPEVIINCAGATGRPNIDWCEEHKAETIYSNVAGPLVLAKVCEELGKYWVHLSSGCIYEGDNKGRGFSEEDKPTFYGSFYSKSKIWSEEMLKEFDDLLILRLRMPITSECNERNFITKIANHKKQINIENSITVIDDFLNAAKFLIEHNKTGIYNMANPGTITHKEILDMYKEIVDKNHSCEYITLEELERNIVKTRRSNCVLNTEKIEKEFKMRNVKEAVRDCLFKYKP